MTIFTRVVMLFVLLSAAYAHAQNYDEAKVPNYSLPELLKTFDNKVVTDKKMWEKNRRPEVLQMFADNVYGQIKKTFDSFTYTVTHEDPVAMNGKARLKNVQVSVAKAGKRVTINLVMFVPNHIAKPAPVFLLINNRDKTNTDPERIVRSEFWPAEMVIEKGFAIAAFHVSDLAPDDKEHYKDGVLQLYPDQLTADNGMKAIGAWAWGASRVIDYFVNDGDVDASKVCIVGHSRGGKAALWAGAQDQRIAIVFSNCSGNSGAALSRRRFGETISRINDRFPHWFCNNYRKYNDREAALPVDQHMLIGLMAPRPVYVTSASEDLWADPRGSYLSLKHAEKVYALYYDKAGVPPEPPPLNTPIIRSYLGYHNRTGVHNMTAFDWANFIKFAQFHFKEK